MNTSDIQGLERVLEVHDKIDKLYPLDVIDNEYDLFHYILEIRLE